MKIKNIRITEKGYVYTIYYNIDPTKYSDFDPNNCEYVA